MPQENPQPAAHALLGADGPPQASRNPLRDTRAADRAQRIVREIEPQNREQSVALVARAEYSLRNIAAASRFRPRIPESPPLHAEVDAERDNRNGPQRFAGEAAG